MKYYFAIIAIIVSILSCKNNKPSQNNSNSFTSKQKTTDSLIKKFARIINGDWVSIDYVKDLKKTKSAYKSYQDGYAGIDDELYIDTKNIAGDSLPMVVEDGDGGGGPGEYTLFFKEGKTPNSVVLLQTWRFDSSITNLSYELTERDTFLLLYRYNRSGTKISSSKKYCRIHNELTGDDTITTISNEGLSYFNNKILVSGDYYYSDSSGRKHFAKFNDFGKVKGIKTFKTYYIDDVFSQGPSGDTDIITFDNYCKTHEDYIFSIQNDTLNLFACEFSDNYDSILHSSLKYILVRIK